MGYNVKFKGAFRFDLPLLQETIERLKALEGVDFRSLGGDYPGFYYPWKLSSDWSLLEWDQMESPRYYVEWLQWVIDNVLKPANRKLLGVVAYSGEDVEDHGVLAIDEDQRAGQLCDLQMAAELDKLVRFRAFVEAHDCGENILRDWEAIGIFAGERCNRNGCNGIIDEKGVDDCYCHTMRMPPCSACTEPRVYCPECDWTPT